jgi:hypothetical protein
MPASFFDTSVLGLYPYDSSRYREKTIDWRAMCEAVLLSNKDYAMAIEFNTSGYYVLQFDGYFRFLRSPMDTSDRGHDIIKPSSGNFTFIGYRRTKLKQYRSCPGIYRLTYDKTNGTIVTTDGILIPEFDIDSLSGIDYSYAGYKDMLQNGAYAVVYQGQHPVFLDRTFDNKLVMRN